MKEKTLSEKKIEDGLNYFVRCGLLKKNKKGYINAHPIMNIDLNRKIIFNIFKKTEKEYENKIKRFIERLKENKKDNVPCNSKECEICELWLKKIDRLSKEEFGEMK